MDVIGFNLDTGKSQWIRLLDVVLIGPLMIAGGIALTEQKSSLGGIVLGALGIATIAYSGRNWYLVRQLQQQALPAPAPGPEPDPGTQTPPFYEPDVIDV